MLCFVMIRDNNIAQDADISLDVDKLSDTEGSSDFLLNMQHTMGGDLDNGSGEEEYAVSDSSISATKDTFREMLETESLEVNDIELDILESSKIDASNREPFKSTDIDKIQNTFPSVSDIITGQFLTGITKNENNEVEEEEGSGCFLYIWC